MRRTGALALVLALVTSVAAVGVVTAHGNGFGHGWGRAVGKAKVGPPKLWVKGSAARPGGTLHILALVRAPKAQRPATVQVIVHFASGNVTLTLERFGRSRGVAFHGKVKVPDTQPAGRVKLDATAVVDGATLTDEGTGQIVVAKKKDETAKPSNSAAPSTAPSVTAAPTVEPSVEPTAEPTAAPSVEPTVQPSVEPTADPSATAAAERDEPGVAVEALLALILSLFV